MCSIFQGSGNKKRRSVAFKKQNYHSVYEYPKEVVALSPAYSEPQLTGAWERNFGAGSRLFAVAGGAAAAAGATSAAPFSTTTTMAAAATLSGATTDLTGLDGFTVSSSQRPFHGGGGIGGGGAGGVGNSIGGVGGGSSSQFNAQCHNTWPTTDADFSWSQIQVSVAPDASGELRFKRAFSRLGGRRNAKGESVRHLHGHADQVAKGSRRVLLLRAGEGQQR